MTKEYVFLSFFKSNNIDYRYYSNLSLIEFPCIHCRSSANMNSKTSIWTCSSCKKTGNIVSLIEYSKQNKFGSIYMPSKEKKSILRIIKGLSRKYPEEQSLTKVERKLNDLINFYEKTP